MDARGQANLRGLIEAIHDPSATVLVANLIKLAVETLRQLAAIDDWIADFIASEEDLGESLGVLVPRLREGAFRRVHLFIEFLISQDLLEAQPHPLIAAQSSPPPPNEEAAPALVDEPEEDFDLSFFDEAAERFDEPEPMPALDEGDIEEAFDSISEERQISSDEKMATVRENLRILGNALRDQLEATERLIDEAYGAGRYETVLREIDMGRESLTEGLFAIVTSIFDVFRCDFQRDAFLPGYKNALQKSLMIRRAVADLTHALAGENEVIQDETLPRDLRVYALRSAQRLLQEFQAKPAFQQMRWMDQLEISRFMDQIGGEFGEAVIAMEALSRYLESLSAVNQREVLVEHDRQVTEDVHASLDAARSLLDVSVSGARPLVADAIRKSVKLYGRHPALDAQLRAWRENPPIARTRDDLAALVATLENLLF